MTLRNRTKDTKERLPPNSTNAAKSHSNTTTTTSSGGKPPKNTNKTRCDCGYILLPTDEKKHLRSPKHMDFLAFVDMRSKVEPEEVCMYACMYVMYVMCYVCIYVWYVCYLYM